MRKNLKEIVYGEIDWNPGEPTYKYNKKKIEIMNLF
jgi:hypothetical protein